MFTTGQIKAAHSKVRSGADFPAYIQAIKSLGVTHYEAYVVDGHINYHGANNHSATVPAKYNPVDIADFPRTDTFQAALLAHQQGKTDYPTFIRMCAETGIEKWTVCMKKMTCTYFDKSGNVILEEEILQ